MVVCLTVSCPFCPRKTEVEKDYIDGLAMLARRRAELDNLSTDDPVRWMRQRVA